MGADDGGDYATGNYPPAGDCKPLDARVLPVIMNADGRTRGCSDGVGGLRVATEPVGRLAALWRTHARARGVGGRDAECGRAGADRAVDERGVVGG